MKSFKLFILSLLLAISVPMVTQAAGLPANAHFESDGTHWRCDYGYKRVNNYCEKVQVPAHAHLNTAGNRWICDTGYVLMIDHCIPSGGDNNYDYDDDNYYDNDYRYCGSGYEWNGRRCVRDNDYYNNDYCRNGYYWNGNRCVRDNYYDNDYCQNGYYWNGYRCVRGDYNNYPSWLLDSLNTPPCGYGLYDDNYNSRYCNSGQSYCQNGCSNYQQDDYWRQCPYGFTENYGRCVRIVIPANAHLNDYGDGWCCNQGYRRYQNRCIREY